MRLTLSEHQRQIRRQPGAFSWFETGRMVRAEPGLRTTSRNSETKTGDDRSTTRGLRVLYPFPTVDLDGKAKDRPVPAWRVL